MSGGEKDVGVSGIDETVLPESGATSSGSAFDQTAIADSAADRAAQTPLSGMAVTVASPSLAGMSATGESLARGESLGRYVVLDLIGKGGMGEVYAAYDPQLDRRVALKVIRSALGATHEEALAPTTPSMVQSYRRAGGVYRCRDRAPKKRSKHSRAIFRMRGVRLLLFLPLKRLQPASGAIMQNL